MVEVQAHGFSFEQWVRRTHFADYPGTYGQKWDVPAEANAGARAPTAFHHLPVSIKTAKFGSPINLGDILRQRQIATDFLMIVGFWRQCSDSEKWFEEIGAVHFTSAAWASLWGDLTLAQLQTIDAAIKDLHLPYAAARRAAREWKRSTPAVATSQLIVNPKIDSKTQRRIQCSLPFDLFWQHAGRAPAPRNAPELWGHLFPNPVRSAPRRFRT